MKDYYAAIFSDLAEDETKDNQTTKEVKNAPEDRSRNAVPALAALSVSSALLALAREVQALRECLETKPARARHLKKRPLPADVHALKQQLKESRDANAALKEEVECWEQSLLYKRSA